MKNSKEIKNQNIPSVKIDQSLNKFDGIVLFPEKLELANKKLSKIGLPKLKLS
jgi:hypothetical protein